MKEKISKIFVLSILLGIALTLVFDMYAESAERQSGSSGCPFLKAVSSCCEGSKSACPNKDIKPSAGCCKGDESKNDAGNAKQDSSGKGTGVENLQSSNKCCVSDKCCECCISGKCSNVCKCEDCSCKNCKCSQGIKASARDNSTCEISGCTCQNICRRGKMCTCWFNA